MSNKRVIFILGPTSVGKSAVAMTVARKLNGAIISADSMQVYRGMNIGTAKPSAADRAQITHHLVDLIEPEQAFSVADFLPLAHQAVTNVRQQGRQPLVVGGSSLYVRALLAGYRFPPAAGDPELRQNLYLRAERLGTTTLHAELAEVDEQAAQRIHPHDVRRIVRALEFWQLTGKQLSAEEDRREDIGERLVFGLTMDRKELYARIDARVDNMIGRGLIDEVARLVQRGLSADNVAMQAVGYKELARFINKEIDLEQAVTEIKRNSRRLAKRQYTWLRREPDLQWIDVSRGCHNEAIAIICTKVGEVN